MNVFNVKISKEMPPGYMRDEKNLSEYGKYIISSYGVAAAKEYIYYHDPEKQFHRENIKLTFDEKKLKEKTDQMYDLYKEYLQLTEKFKKENQDLYEYRDRTVSYASLLSERVKNTNLFTSLKQAVDVYKFGGEFTKNDQIILPTEKALFVKDEFKDQVSEALSEIKERIGYKTEAELKKDLPLEVEIVSYRLALPRIYQYDEQNVMEYVESFIENL